MLIVSAELQDAVLKKWKQNHLSWEGSGSTCMHITQKTIMDLKNLFNFGEMLKLYMHLSNEKKIMDIFPNSKFKNSINLSQSNLNSNLNY